MHSTDAAYCYGHCALSIKNFCFLAGMRANTALPYISHRMVIVVLKVTLKCQVSYCTIWNNNSNHHFMAIIQINLHYTSPPVKNWMILLVQSFTARMPLLMATAKFGLVRKCWSSVEQCYLHCLLVNFENASNITLYTVNWHRKRLSFELSVY